MLCQTKNFQSKPFLLFTLKRATSPEHSSIKPAHLLVEDVKAVSDCLQYCYRFSGPGIWTWDH